MNINTKLDEEFSHQQFRQGHDAGRMETEYMTLAHCFAAVENGIAVLSNLNGRVSHIYYGAMGEFLGIAGRGTHHRIESIWEEEILSHVHPDDLIAKQLQELKFFQYAKKDCSGDPSGYSLESCLRMADASGTYHAVTHRIFYCNTNDRDIWLALCLYSFGTEGKGDAIIRNNTNGEVIRLTENDYTAILSNRETSVLRLIEQGKSSKEIAGMLSISVNTVNRHRQNILEKLHAGNSIEACRTAKELRII